MTEPKMWDVVPADLHGRIAEALAADPKLEGMFSDDVADYSSPANAVLAVVAPELQQLATELALFRERDALTRKALQAEGDGLLQLLALRVRQERDRAAAERDTARTRLRGMARRASKLRRSREKWRRLAGKQVHERVGDMAASMASNGQLRAENRRVKAERDEALAALEKQQALVDAMPVTSPARLSPADLPSGSSNLQTPEGLSEADEDDLLGGGT